MRRCLLISVLIAVLGAPAAHATFPGANGKISFTRFVAGGNSCISTMNSDGSGQAVVSPCDNDKESAWSPSGSKLAYESGFMIVTADPDGSNVSFAYDTGIGTTGIGWSPDGQRLVATDLWCPRSFNCTISELFTVRTDGTGYTRLLQRGDEGLANFFSPDWSPDGQKIAFTNKDDEFEYRTWIGLGPAYIYTVNSDGTGLTRLTATYGNAQPSWSPDGSKIAFSTSRHNGEYCSGELCDEEIYVMNRDGSAETRLTSSTGRDLEPAWSPDGKWIVFVKERGHYPEDTPSDLYAVKADGSQLTRLTELSVFHPNDPDWQPIPNSPPNCAAVTATPGTLDARGGLRLVSLAGAGDPDGDPVTLTVTGITQDEPLTGSEDKTSPDAFSSLLSPNVPSPDTQPNEAYLRAERRNSGDGRVYRLAFTGSDGRGGSCAGTAKVGVPRRSAAAVDSAPPSYSSTG